MKKEQNIDKPQLNIGAVMQRTWKILFIAGVVGLVTELLFLVAELAIVGNQTEGRYAIIWLASSMLCLTLSGIIALIIHGKPHLIRLRDWVYEE